MLSDKEERDLREQLDGEQKLSKHWYSEFVKLRKQLAAKEELHDAALQVLERHHQKQLAVAREALEDAKAHIPARYGIIHTKLTAALAKLGEEK